MLATKTSQKLKELAGGMTECFLHLPSTFAMDLFEQAILWRITWKEKMLLLVDFLLTHESELVIPLRKQINLSLPLKASMGQNPDEINDNFLLLFIQRLLEKHWDHHLLVRTVDDLLLGLLDVNEEVLQPFLEYVRLKAPILYPLLDLLYPSDPRKRLFGYNEFFLTPLFLIAFAGGSSELRKLLEQKPPVIGGIDELFSTLLDVYLSFREESYAGLLFSELEETFFQGHALRNFFENKKVGILLIGEYAYAYGFEIPRLWNLSIVGKPYKSLLLDQLHEEWVDSSHSSYSRLSQFIRKMYSEVLRDLPMERRIDELEEFLSRSVSEFQYFDKAFNIASASLIPNTYNNLIKFCDLLLDISESWPSPMILNAVGFILEKMHLFEEFPDEILSSLNHRRTPKPLIQRLSFFKSSVARAVSDIDSELPEILTTLVRDFIFILGIVGAGYDKETIGRFAGVIPHSREISQMNARLQKRKEIPFSWISYLSSTLALVVLAHLLFSSPPQETLRLISSREKAEQLIVLVNKLWQEDGISPGFLVVLYYRLMELLIFAMKRELEGSAILLLTVFTHAFPRWTMDNPSALVNSMFALRNQPNLSEFNHFLLETFHKSFVSSTESFSSLNATKQMEITKFLSGQSWFVRDLFSPFLAS